MSRSFIVGLDFHLSILSIVDNKLRVYRVKYTEIESISNNSIIVLQNLRSMSII